MTVLGFRQESETVHGKRVRRACFERRSLLPVSAACVVASGVRETLGALLASPVSLRLLEPVIPDPAAWSAICAGAQLFGLRGQACDAAFVLRPGDALALTSSAFGEEPDAAARELSAVEHRVLLRALRGIAGCLCSVCGPQTSALERILDIGGYVTYFELLVERPVCARIGVALSRDPAAQRASTLRIEDLLDVEIELSVDFARGALPAGAFLDLRAGTNVPMTTRIGEPGCLRVGGAVLARGECGAMGGRNAMIVTTLR